MSDVIKMNTAISEVDQNELQSLADAMQIDVDRGMRNKSVMSIPITSLAELGSVASSLVPLLQMATNQSASTAQGIYTIANIDAGEVLKAAKNGNYWGSVKKADGSSKLAQLKQVGTLDGKSAAISIDPTMIMMAVALHSIEQRLNKIQEIQQDILSFLENDKESKIEANMQTLYGIISKYKYTWDNEQMVSGNLNIVASIMREECGNIRLYQKQVTALLEKKQLLVAQNSVVSACADMKRKFTYYRMSLYNYALAALLEIILSQNFREGNIREAKSEIEQLAMEYRNVFENASLYLEKMSTDAITKKVFKGLGTAGQSVGKFIGNIPILEKGPIDEMLQAGGEKLSGKAEELEKKAVREFASLGNPGTAILTDRIQDLDWIYNHTQSIRADRERIYLVGESA